MCCHNIVTQCHFKKLLMLTNSTILAIRGHDTWVKITLCCRNTTLGKPCGLRRYMFLWVIYYGTVNYIIVYRCDLVMGILHIARYLQTIKCFIRKANLKYFFLKFWVWVKGIFFYFAKCWVDPWDVLTLSKKLLHCQFLK